MSELFQKHSSEWFKRIIVSVTVVRISPDLSVAKVYVSSFPKSDDDILKTLNAINREIRYKLGQRVKHQLRIVPELKFFTDDSLDYANHIDDLLNDPS